MIRKLLVRMSNVSEFMKAVNAMTGSDWGDLAVIQGLRRQVFG
jgi:hypothetical protein